jgi:hypothetical protein
VVVPGLKDVVQGSTCATSSRPRVSACSSFFCFPDEPRKIRGLSIRSSRQGGLDGARPARARQERHPAAPTRSGIRGHGREPAGLQAFSAGSDRGGPLVPLLPPSRSSDLAVKTLRFDGDAPRQAPDRDRFFGLEHRLARRKKMLGQVVVRHLGQILLQCIDHQFRDRLGKLLLELG